MAAIEISAELTLGELIVGGGTALLAVGTGLMAWFTRFQAKATRIQAEASSEQAEASRRLAEIAERELGLQQEQHHASTVPRIRWARNPRGEPYVPRQSSSGFLLKFEYVSGPPAQIVRAALSGRAGRVQKAHVSSDKQGAVDFRHPVSEDAWGPCPLRIEYVRAGAVGTAPQVLTADVSWDGRRLDYENLVE